jgi:hypothetical protein
MITPIPSVGKSLLYLEDPIALGVLVGGDIACDVTSGVLGVDEHLRASLTEGCAQTLKAVPAKNFDFSATCLVCVKRLFQIADARPRQSRFFGQYLFRTPTFKARLGQNQTMAELLALLPDQGENRIGCAGAVTVNLILSSTPTVQWLFAPRGGQSPPA